MIPSMIKIINSIDAEIDEETKSRAWIWADRNFDGVWSKAHDRLSNSLETTDMEFLQNELDIYKYTLKEMIKKYMKEKQISATHSFLLSIAKTENQKSKIVLEEDHFPIEQNGTIPGDERRSAESKCLFWFLKKLKDCISATEDQIDQIDSQVLSFRETGDIVQLRKILRDTLANLKIIAVQKNNSPEISLLKGLVA